MHSPERTFLLGLVLGLIVAAGTFFAGLTLGQSQAQTSRASSFGTGP